MDHTPSQIHQYYFIVLFQELMSVSGNLVSLVASAQMKKMATIVSVWMNDLEETASVQVKLQVSKYFVCSHHIVDHIHSHAMAYQ